MDYKKRIESILDVYKVNASEFAEKIDVPRSSISHILSGRNNPSLDFMIKVKEVYPELDWNFLLLGKLPMFTKNDNTLSEISSSENPIIELPFENNPNIEFSEGLNESKKDETSPIFDEKLVENKTKIEKIVFFYNDGSFKSYENKI